MTTINVLLLICLFLTSICQPLSCLADSSDANVVIGVPTRAIQSLIDEVDVQLILQKTLKELDGKISSSQVAEQKPFEASASYHINTFQIKSMGAPSVTIIAGQDNPEIILSVKDICIAARDCNAKVSAKVHLPLGGGTIGPGVAVKLAVDVMIPELQIRMGVKLTENGKGLQFVVEKGGLTLSETRICMTPKMEKISSPEWLVPNTEGLEFFLGSFLLTALETGVVGMVRDVFEPTVISSLANKVSKSQIRDISEILGITKSMGSDSTISNSITLESLTLSKGCIQLRALSQWSAQVRGVDYSPARSAEADALPDAFSQDEMTALIGTSFLNQLLEVVWHTNPTVSHQSVESVPFGPKWLARLLLFRPFDESAHVDAELEIRPPILVTGKRFRVLVAADAAVSFKTTNRGVESNKTLLEVGVNTTTTMNGPSFDAIENIFKLTLSSFGFQDLEVSSDLTKNGLSDWVTGILQEVLVDDEADSTDTEKSVDKGECLLQSAKWWKTLIGWINLKRPRPRHWLQSLVVNKFGARIQVAVNNGIGNAIDTANEKIADILRSIKIPVFPIDTGASDPVKIEVKEVNVKPDSTFVKLGAVLTFAEW